jgi:tetratricopeptide (TPR) repeat protein
MVYLVQANLVQALYYQDRGAEAESLCREMLAWSRANLGENDYETTVNVLDLAIALTKQERFDEAIPLAEDALHRVDQHFGEKSLPGVGARQTLSWILLQAGSASDAELVARDALELAEAVLPRAHHMRSRLANDIAEALIAQGRSEEAIEILSSALSEGVLGPEHPLTLAAQRLLAKARPASAE